MLSLRQSLSVLLTAKNLQHRQRIRMQRKQSHHDLMTQSPMADYQLGWYLWVMVFPLLYIWMDQQCVHLYTLANIWTSTDFENY